MNIPNALALSRIIITPVLFFLLVNRGFFVGVHEAWLDYAAGFLFVLAGLTDLFDGYIARTFNQSTVLGSILDSIADKMLVLACFIGLMVIDRANVWAVFLILSREFFITGLRINAASRNVEVASSIHGKIKTFLQILAISFLIMDWHFAQALLWLCVFFTLYSGYEYIKFYMGKL